MKTDYRTVRLTGGFWKLKEDLNRDITIPAVYNRFDETGRIRAFRCDWKEGMPDMPHIFWDSDVVKWMEGAAYVLSRENIPELEEKVESLIDEIEKNQGEDGYFNIHFTVVKPEARFTNRDWHELYCAGHLMEAAVAYFEATGRDRFLKIAEKYATYIKAVFMDKTAGPTPTFSTPGHEEIELALYRLYRCTGNRDWLDLCAHFINTRGTDPSEGEGTAWANGKQVQSHIPVREQFSAVGHSVRAGYLYTAMADLAGETGDEALMTACRRLYEDLVYGKMYITGGLGSTCHGEAFTIPYDMPNDQAYTETCASIAMIYFAHRMNKIEHDAKYADTIEKELYNGMLSGLSLSGDAFFYENPLEIHLDNYKKQGGRYPITRRQKVFGCSCCPPNLNRVLSSLGQYFYAWEDGTVWVNQFGDSTFASDGMKVTQATEYPVNGEITITAEGTETLYVRIPDWCPSFTADRDYVMEKGYAKFAGDGVIHIVFTMLPTLMQSAVGVYKNLDKAALQYGPLIYCAEGIDHDGDVHSLYFNTDPKAADWQMEVCETCGLPVFTGNGARRIDHPNLSAHPAFSGYPRPIPQNALYYPLDLTYQPARLRMIPYHTFANREETNMIVYLGYGRFSFCEE
ncbi:MAG: glycoside hydrolase family 127 protein [Clostridia bacterium]|nr:glycoside hydrolase family 127 protein [Clostridia bacterium]